MLINSPNISGSLTVTGNTVISGSLTVLGTGSIRDNLIVSNTDPTVQGNSSTGAFYIRGSVLYNFGGNLTLYPSLWRQQLENISFISGNSDLVWAISANGGVYAEKMRLNSSGNLMVGTTSNTGQRLQVSGDTRLSGSFTVIATGSAVEFQVINTGVTLGNISTDFHTVTGSFSVSGSTRLNGNTIVTGSFTVTTGSVVELQVTNTGVNIGNVTTDNHNITGSLKVSGSFTVTTTGTELQVTNTGVNLGNIATDVHNVTGSLRVSGSNQFNGSQAITGSLTVTGQVVAQTLNVQQVTSSIVFSSGSNIFGNSLSNTQQFTGSLQVTGSTHYLLGSVGVGSTSPVKTLDVQGTLAISNSPSSYWYMDRDDSDGRFKILTDANAERFNITTDGNIGIGTTSPSASLDIVAPAGVSNPTVLRTYSNQHGLGFKSIISGTYTTIETNNTSYPLVFNPSGGNVGIGTNSVNAKLEVAVGTDKFRLSRTSAGEVDFSIDSSGNAIYDTTIGAGQIFRTNGGSERMRITSGGITIVGHTTGVGTNFSPPIQVKGGAGIGNGFGIISGNNEMVGGLQLVSSGTNSLQIAADPDNLRSSSEIGFTIDGSIRMLITSGGTVQVQSGGVETQNGGGYQFWNEAQSRWWLMYTYTAASNQLRFNYFGNDVGSINPSTGAYTALSDINKKKDFEQSTIGLNAILGLKPTLYRMRNDESEGDKELGFIAQEVKEFIPQAYVESGKDGEKFIGLNYNAIVAALVKSVQELKTKIEILEQS
jgi:hypothetical protein